MSETFLDGRVTLHCGDNREVLKTLADNSIHSIVCDPPYALVSIQKRFGKPGSAPVRVGDINESNNLKAAYARASAGFMGKQWDTGETAFAVEFWAECLRVLKPGGHVVAFSGTRTYHRMACAIEDAGFEVREQLQWVFGSGFPKSHDVSKGIDKAFGAEREVVGAKMFADGTRARKTQMLGGNATFSDSVSRESNLVVTAPATPQAAEWEGWGTALKPAHEPICLARKPLSEKTVAANVLKWGTGAINVDGCRVDGAPDPASWTAQRTAIDTSDGRLGQKAANIAAMNAGLVKPPSGRWPANIIHDGSEEVLAAFPDAPGQQRSVGPQHGAKDSVNVYGDYGPRDQFEARGDSGSAARFFYTTKADSDDRLGSRHPTVKPVDLMQWLCRLVTPKGGTVLDPFAGTGTTAEAAFREGFNAILIEREEEYQADIRRRMALCLAGPDERARESIKAKLKDTPMDAGPLFGALT